MPRFSVLVLPLGPRETHGLKGWGFVCWFNRQASETLHVLECCVVEVLS